MKWLERTFASKVHTLSGKVPFIVCNLNFLDGSDGLFVPSSPQPTLERQPFITPGKCSTHSFTMEFWCYEDEVPLCKGCRISYHLQHDVVKIIDRNKVEMEVFYSVADETVQLVDEMKKTCKEIKDQTKRVQSEYDVAIKEVIFFFLFSSSII